MVCLYTIPSGVDSDCVDDTKLADSILAPCKMKMETDCDKNNNFLKYPYLVQNTKEYILAGLFMK